MRTRYVGSRLRLVLLDWWTEDLGSPAAGLAMVDAVRLHLRGWVKRRHGVLTFRLTQVLAGHGGFGKYRQRVSSEESVVEEAGGCAPRANVASLVSTLT